MTTLTETDCQDAAALRELEWLETDGQGGYASGTLLTSHSRRYHALLTANLPPPASGRHAILAKFEESLLLPDGEEAFFTCHHYPGFAFLPRLPERFEADPCPCWTYRFPGGRTLTRAVLMPQGAGPATTTLCRYQLTGGAGPATLRLRPFIAGRPHHNLMRRNSFINGTCHPLPDGTGIRLEPYAGLPPLHLQWPAGTLRRLDPAAAGWYEKFELLQEQRRGQDFQEDLFLPAILEFTIEPGQPFFIAATAAAAPLTAAPAELWRQELARRRRAETANRAWLQERATRPGDLDPAATLMRAAARLAIQTPTGRPALLAGYPWFEDWGRDTMVALPGCLFLGPRREEGFRILAAFCDREKDGLLPNFINPDGSAAYNSADAALWFFCTVQHYLQAGGSLAKVQRQLWPAMKRILQAYTDGIATPPVAMQFNGLLRAGTPATQLTWMDAKSRGLPVTPRWGLAVELNALWYNALAFAADLARTFRDPDFQPPLPLTAIAAEFRRTFWLADAGHLADVVNSDGTDRSLRPNQLFAAALPHSPLTKPQMAAVVAAVRRPLPTPRGLRTLDPADPRYRGHYTGDMADRDAAYHQGTVWPWLLGAYAAAWLKTTAGRRAARAELRAHLEGWTPHFREAGIGCVSEIFDGDPPHRPDGCILQAWSAAELLRAWHLLWEAERHAATAAATP
ncbi:MAG: amylo-alpha-1,6-glucosidase [Lentisphaeria bacterium]